MSARHSLHIMQPEHVALYRRNHRTARRRLLTLSGMLAVHSARASAQWSGVTWHGQAEHAMELREMTASTGSDLASSPNDLTRIVCLLCVEPKSE